VVARPALLLGSAHPSRLELPVPRSSPFPRRRLAGASK
jgi:hypothetical protein